MNNNDYESVKKSREICKVILDYGVSQQDILNIIRKLSLELEDLEIQNKLYNCLNKKQNNDTIKLDIQI